MKDTKRLLELRNKMQKTRPKFLRQEGHKIERLEKKWRKPKGLHSKMRHHKKGNRCLVEVGYCSPTAVKGLHRTGLKIVLVHSMNDIENLNPKEDGALISSTIGMKKKIMIIRKAKERNIHLLNIKDADAWLKQSEEEISKKKSDKKAKESKKSEKKKEIEKKSEKAKPKELSETLSEEEKKQKEKEEKDKILTKSE